MTNRRIEIALWGLMLLVIHPSCAPKRAPFESHAEKPCPDAWLDSANHWRCDQPGAADARPTQSSPTATPMKTDTPLPTATSTRPPEGPFGLRFGMSRAEVKYPRTKVVSFRSKPDVLSMESHCYDAVLEAWHISAPADFLINLENIGGVPRDLSHAAFGINSIGADFAASGNIAAAIHSIPILSKQRKVCLGFYKDQLFLVRIDSDGKLNTQDDWDAIEESAKASLKVRYGVPQEQQDSLDYSCIRGSMTTYCYSTWVSQSDRVYIRNENVRSISYVYEPIKHEELEEVVHVYLERKERLSHESGF